jgi:hypothetical protein
MTFVRYSGKAAKNMARAKLIKAGEKRGGGRKSGKEEGKKE